MPVKKTQNQEFARLKVARLEQNHSFLPEALFKSASVKVMIVL